MFLINQFDIRRLYLCLPTILSYLNGNKKVNIKRIIILYAFLITYFSFLPIDHLVYFWVVDLHLLSIKCQRLYVNILSYLNKDQSMLHHVRIRPNFAVIKVTKKFFKQVNSNQTKLKIMEAIWIVVQLTSYH